MRKNKRFIKVSFPVKEVRKEKSQEYAIGAVENGKQEIVEVVRFLVSLDEWKDKGVKI